MGWKGTAPAPSVFFLAESGSKKQPLFQIAILTENEKETWPDHTMVRVQDGAHVTLSWPKQASCSLRPAGAGRALLSPTGSFCKALGGGQGCLFLSPKGRVMDWENNASTLLFLCKILQKCIASLFSSFYSKIPKKGRGCCRGSQT